MTRNIIYCLFGILALAVLVSCEIKGLNSIQQALGAISVEGSNGEYRIMTYENNTAGTFSVSGMSVGASGTTASASYSNFYFSSGGASAFSLPLSYYYIYSETQVNPGSVSSNGLVAAYFPSLVVEYEETNGQAGYQLDEDTVLGWIRLDMYGKFNVTCDTTPLSSGSASSSAYVVEASSPDNIFSMRFTVAGFNVNTNGISLTPEQSKVDVVINNYYTGVASSDCNITSAPFSCLSTGPSSNPNSRLSFGNFFLSSKYSIEANANSLSFGGSQGSVGISWVNNVEVDGATHSVTSTIYASSKGKTLLAANVAANYSGDFIFNSFDAVRPNSVIWDPTVGLTKTDSSTPSSANTLTLSLTLLVTLLLSTLLF